MTKSNSGRVYTTFYTLRRCREITISMRGENTCFARIKRNRKQTYNIVPRFEAKILNEMIQTTFHGEFSFLIQGNRTGLYSFGSIFFIMCLTVTSIQLIKCTPEIYSGNSSRYPRQLLYTSSLTTSLRFYESTMAWHDQHSVTASFASAAFDTKLEIGKDGFIIR